MKTFFKRLRAAPLAALVLAVTFAACKTEVEETDEADGATGKALIRIDIGAARSIMPTSVTTGDITKYEITLEKSGSPTVPIQVEDDDIAKITSTGITTPQLLKGTWTVTVDAYRKIESTEYKAASGSGSLNIIAGSTSAKVTISLAPIPIASGGNGVFKWNFTLPSDVSLTTFTLGGSIPSGGALNGSIEKAAGIYTLVIVLTKGSTNQTAGLCENVHIYSGLESSAVYDFTSSTYKLDFADGVLIKGNLNITQIGAPSYTGNYTLQAFTDAECETQIEGASASVTGTGAVPYILKIPVDDYVSLSPSKTVYIKASIESGDYILCTEAADVSDISVAGKTGASVIAVITSNDVVTTELHKVAAKIGESSLEGALTYINAVAASGDNYTLTLKGNDEIAPTSLSYSGKTVGITLQGADSERTVSLSSTGAMFTIGGGAALTLGENITLQGRSYNDAGLIAVNSGSFVMESGVKITGNIATSGGGVWVYNGGTFTMSGGEISGNTSGSGGGGVYVDNGTFTMNGGEISGNIGGLYGGGVYVSSGTFKKQPAGGDSSGVIKDNTIYGGSTTNGKNVYVSATKKRETNVESNQSLDSTQDGSAGGWTE